MLHARPRRHGLYDPRFEHDACGVAFVVDMAGRASHDIVATAIGALCNLEHRGATGAEVNTGDGAGVLLQIPDAYYRAVAGVDLPRPGAYVTGIAFLPPVEDEARAAVAAIEAIAADEGLCVLGWRAVATDPSALGQSAQAVMPAFRQVFLTDRDGATDLELERKAFIVRKRTEREIATAAGHDWPYFPSLSCRTVVYKGMLTAPQLGAFYPELGDERFASALALVHSRFSTNTFPAWPLAHPY